jgi:hypothetical protein
VIRWLLCQEEHAHQQMMTRHSCTADTWIKCAWLCEAKSQDEGLRSFRLQHRNRKQSSSDRLLSHLKAKQVVIPGLESALLRRDQSGLGSKNIRHLTHRKGKAERAFRTNNLRVKKVQHAGETLKNHLYSLRLRTAGPSRWRKVGGAIGLCGRFQSSSTRIEVDRKVR